MTDEWIAGCKPFYHLAIVHVFRIERAARTLHCGRDDERVVGLITLSLRRSLSYIGSVFT